MADVIDLKKWKDGRLMAWGCGCGSDDFTFWRDRGWHCSECGAVFACPDAPPVAMYIRFCNLKSMPTDWCWAVHGSGAHGLYHHKLGKWLTTDGSEPLGEPSYILSIGGHPFPAPE